MWWPPYQWYSDALLIVALVSALSGRLKNAVGAAVVSTDYLGMQWVDDQYCVFANMAFCVVLAELTFAFCSGALRGYLLLTWSALMCCYIGYASSGNETIYWYSTSFLSWAQAALIMAFGGIDGGKRIRSWMDRGMRLRSDGLSLGLARRCGVIGTSRSGKRT
jgi:hypothetical protein